MSEEERKILKVLINNKDVFYYEDDFNNRIRPLVGKLLDLYKQEKEKNKILEANGFRNGIYEKDGNYISKDKIRQKITELNKSDYIEDNIAISYLKELLEE